MPTTSTMVAEAVDAIWFVLAVARLRLTRRRIVAGAYVRLAWWRPVEGSITMPRDTAFRLAIGACVAAAAAVALGAWLWRDPLVIPVAIALSAILLLLVVWWTASVRADLIRVGSHISMDLWT